MKTRRSSCRTPVLLQKDNDKHVKSNKKASVGKSVRKKLIMEDDNLKTSSLTDENVLDQIVALSPISKSRNSKENIKPTISSCYSLSSPLKELSIYSPTLKLKQNLQINARSPDGAVESPRKRVLEDSTKDMHQVLNIQARTPQKHSFSESYLEKNCQNFLSPKKAKSHDNDENSATPFTNTCSFPGKKLTGFTTPEQSAKKNACQIRSAKKHSATKGTVPLFSIYISEPKKNI